MEFMSRLSFLRQSRGAPQAPTKVHSSADQIENLYDAIKDSATDLGEDLTDLSPEDFLKALSR